MRILLIDDDEQLMEVLADKLIEQHYAVDIATTGEMGREFILLFNYDLVVLDLMLPDIYGIELCQQIRSEGYDTPIMLLTASDRQKDKIMGLDAGADDYVVKPFNFEELTARIRALLRREIHVASPILNWQELSLDPKTHEVKYENQLLPLTPKEYALIELLMRHPQQVFSPGAIIDSIWAGEDPPGEEAVRTHIKGLRQKLQGVGMAKDTIQTVYGVGYRLKSPSNEVQQQKSSKKHKTLEIINAWSKFKDVAFQRLAILENLASILGKNPISSELLTTTKSSAHKLAGSLGGFGFPQGSKIAKQLENLLATNIVEPAKIKKFQELVSSLKIELQSQPFEERVKETLDNNISLLIIDRSDLEIQQQPDNIYREQLIKEADKQKIKTYNTVFTLPEARELITEKSPTVIIHKIAFPDRQDLAFIQEVHQQMPQSFIVIITEDAELADRLDLVRKGGNLILDYPLEPKKVIESVVELIKKAGAAAKVLIVDDDPQVLLSLEIGLKPWGFQLTTLDNPQQFWEVLEAVEPDLLVLDVEMPKINGLELCQLLRCDRRWQSLPVLFLTVHQDAKTQHQAFAIGADDYIAKPVIASELATRIINRLQRVRAVRC